jgi:hypothetical protein
VTPNALNAYAVNVLPEDPCDAPSHPHHWLSLQCARTVRVTGPDGVQVTYRSLAHAVCDHLVRDNDHLSGATREYVRGVGDPGRLTTVFSSSAWIPSWMSLRTAILPQLLAQALNQDPTFRVRLAMTTTEALRGACGPQMLPLWLDQQSAILARSQAHVLPVGA